MPRYALNETAAITAQFSPSDTVTIDIYDLSDNSKVVNAAPCTEVDGAGAFKYLFTPNPSSFKNYMWVMSNGSYSRKGQISFGNVNAKVADKGVLNNPPSENINDYKADVSGLATQASVDAIAADTALLIKYIKNKKELKKTGAVWQLIIYDDNGTTEILKKDLKDKGGNDITDIQAGALAQELASSV